MYGLVFSIQLPIGKWNNPGAGFVPFNASILLCIAGIVWFAIAKKREEDKAKMDWRGLIKTSKIPLQIVGLTTVFIATLTPLGYLMASALYLSLLFLWVSRYRLRIAIPLAIVFAVGSWLLFGKLLEVQLPSGPWIL